ncbi:MULTISPECIES: hypothetical protein [Bacillaceae]|uniref:hypothetical protein n=1 Tax=Bacillaceae TaxID=186817 RepID=UPI000B9AFE35|nr:hypothetical protein [Bacillus infantis]MDW2878672.1 hypothetical protein [Bacillus infantis]OXT17541.1 hypothetical protein B9K06_09500 [Bacillus sp. OG2]
MNEKKRETWKLWDAMFTSGILSLLKDGEEAQTDDKKFRQLLWQLLFGVIFTFLLFIILAIFFY